jgi:hypothetical protein
MLACMLMRGVPYPHNVQDKMQWGHGFTHGAIETLQALACFHVLPSCSPLYLDLTDHVHVNHATDDTMVVCKPQAKIHMA